MYIVEALVAMVISGIISFALLDMVAGSMRTMNRASGDSQAYELIEELTEYTRTYGYKRLVKFNGQTINMAINKDAGVQFENPTFHSRALLLDFVRRTWKPKIQTSKFVGTVTYQIFDGPEPGTLNAAIDLFWNDSYSGQERALGRVIIVMDVPESL
jgi:type II secretory pathway pseudopilin PulG